MNTYNQDRVVRCLLSKETLQNAIHLSFGHHIEVASIEGVELTGDVNVAVHFTGKDGQARRVFIYATQDQPNRLLATW